MSQQNLQMRNTMLFEFRRQASASKEAESLSEAYHDEAPCLRSVEKWFARFRIGDLNLEDKPRSGRPQKLADEQLLDIDGQMSSVQLEPVLGVDHSTILRRMRKLGYRQRTPFYVPYLLKQVNKNKRVTICKKLLSRHKT